MGTDTPVPQPRPDLASFEPRSANAATHSFDDQVSLEFGDGSDDHDDSAAQRAACVDALPEADELDAETVELVQHFEEVAD